MTSNQKDRICNGEEAQEAINQLEVTTNQNVNINSSLKRHATSECPRYSDDEELNNNSYTSEWNIISNRKQKKKLNDTNDQFALNLTRTFTNSSHHREKQQLSYTYNNNRNGCKINNNNIKVSNYALNYAADYQYPPFKLECEPKLDDKKQGVKLVNELLKYIRNDFLFENPSFSKQILVDIWWIDLEGNMQLIIKTTELYVYLCKKERYPDELINIKINPIPPTHLPPQHTIILKWIKNSITDQDIKDELCINYKSIRSISTMNEKKINLMGQLYDITEFLPAPKILICGRCNQPGHTKKVCLNSSFDICRRCGGNRTNIEEHKECPIKCHHCQAEHLSTDYKCPLIDDYRRQIICELRKHLEKLPQHIQLFIPSEYRNQNDKEKIIQNKTMYHHPQQQQYYCRNDHNQWPLLTSTTTNNTTTNQNMNEIIKSFNDELVELKKKYKEDQQRNEEKYKEHIDLINQTWSIIQQQHQAQHQMITIVTNSIKQINFFTCMTTTTTICNAINKMKMKTNCNDYDDDIQQLTNQAEFIKEAEHSFSTHINSLEQLVHKQNETLNKALGNLLKDPNAK
ncbi:unnamed protein product [Rotaria sp. Silwood2]|nr:unnamed protein product [Rotaria sp. Silwood2]